MKNLHLLYEITRKLSHQNVQQLALDSNSRDILYVCTDREVFQINCKGDITEQIYELASNIIGFEHLPLNNELCIATESGDVIILNLHTLLSETVSYCDGGIETMAWSPDQEIVVFVTKSNLLVVMNSAYEPISENSLDGSAFGDQEFITVGWGKKETQFHGTEGKRAAIQKSEDCVELNIEQINKQISIVWRGDGEYFAAAFITESRRIFKVFDKEGILQFTSEKCNGLESPIFWRPSGTWIAVPQILPNKYIIALFEKNGLKHREIVMPFKAAEESIIRIAWSSDSEVLGIETFNKLIKKSIIYLYIICNYHWYLKQTLEFSFKVKVLQWDSKFSEGKTLHILFEDGTYSIYRWDYSINHSTSRHFGDKSLVTVIDGNNLLITNFGRAIIPPPMCTHTLQVEHPINNVGFLKQSSDRNTFFIIDSSNVLSTYACHFENGENEVKNLNKYKIHISDSNNIPLHLHHWIWLDVDLVVVSHTTKNYTSLLYLCTLENGQNLEVLDNIHITGLIGSITNASNSNCEQPLLVQLTSGVVYKISIENKKFLPETKMFQLNDFCETICAFSHEDSLKIFSLKNKQNLYLNDDNVATDVTSLFLTEKYLAFTTLDQLKFIRLSDGLIINERRMERGGKLIVIVPNDSKTVLQMPRGNLEVIQPRVLTLCIIGDLLTSGLYKTAFDILRKQRINLNILVDHNPAKFISEIDKFIDSIENIQWLNLFLSDLQDNDVTVTMYSSNYDRRDASDDVLIKYKTNIVCEKMCKILTSKGLSKYILPIITSHVKCKNLEAALELIWNIKKTESVNNIEHQKDCVNSQDALKYLLYLVDVNELYNVALGMYDFGLVLFVAAKSQKDPKEYVPFLNELKQFDETYRKYKIDCYLKRFSKALENIAKCGEEKIDESLELIAKHNLYTNALELYVDNANCYKKVVLAFAEQLRLHGKLHDAYLMYERGGDISQAILTAKHILDWQKCITLSLRLGSSKEEIKQLISSLLPALQENGNYLDAADLVLEYQKDYALAIQILSEGRYYSKALYIARINADAVMENTVKVHLDKYVDTLTTTLSEDALQFVTYKYRLTTIREEKANKKLNGSHLENELDDCDMFSDTSSMNSSKFTASSRGTGKTHRSSKNRRKHQRKLLNLKEGNAFEDIALIDALYNLAYKSYNQQIHIETICKCLIDQQQDSKGKYLQKIFSNLLITIRDSLDEIWIPEMITSAQIPNDGTVDYLLLQEEQHYSMIKLNQRFKPQLNIIAWDFEILK